MKYYNIKNPHIKVALSEAILKSVAEESGLYMPEKIPLIKDSVPGSHVQVPLNETAFHVMHHLLGDDIPENVLRKITAEALSFEIPLKSLGNNIFVLELFHGPTFAFKDAGARFLAGILEYLVSDIQEEITVLVATSGDTGGAVASAFAGEKGIRVVILYPSRRVSNIQEQQLLSAGSNIIAVELEGDFDDCQRLVKQAFADRALNEKLILTSANSINIARLFPQAVYYFHAYVQLPERDKPVLFSVPSGNFGNLTAGLIAKRMGLPVCKFIASTNINRSVPEYLDTGVFTPHPSNRTISNAMDVGNPSNFQRILALYENDLQKIKADISGFWFTDDQTRAGMKELADKYSYIADPHTAVAYLGLKKYISGNPAAVAGIFLATAHPGKFPEEVERATGKKVSLPHEQPDKTSSSKHVKLPVDFNLLKDLLTCSL